MSTPENEYLSGLQNNNVFVTGHNNSGLAIVQSSQEGSWSWFPHRNVGFNVIYTTSKLPVNLNDDADITSHTRAMASGALGLVQPGGTVCRIVDFGPQGAPLMHRTQSLDYGVVLEGEIEMELDDGSVTLMRRGDVAVQRGTKHSWRNPSSTAWARMLFVLQDCEPIYVNGARLKEDLGTGSGEIPSSRKDDH
jgi:quercetin dioxygenase-like cupin family protein